MAFQAGQRVTGSVMNGIAAPAAAVGSVANGTNWSVTAQNLFVTEGGCWFANVSVQYTAATTLTPNASGFVSGAPAICTLPKGPPAGSMDVVFHTGSTWGMLIISASGLVQLRAIQSGGSIITNDTVIFGVTFPNAGP